MRRRRNCSPSERVLILEPISAACAIEILYIKSFHIQLGLGQILGQLETRNVSLQHPHGNNDVKIRRTMCDGVSKMQLVGRRANQANFAPIPPLSWASNAAYRENSWHLECKRGCVSPARGGKEGLTCFNKNMGSACARTLFSRQHTGRRIARDVPSFLHLLAVCPEYLRVSSSKASRVILIWKFWRCNLMLRRLTSTLVQVVRASSRGDMNCNAS